MAAHTWVARSDSPGMVHGETQLLPAEPSGTVPGCSGIRPAGQLGLVTSRGVRGGLAALPADEAIGLAYLGDGSPITGTQRWRLVFKAGELPPADAFWSLTL